MRGNQFSLSHSMKFMIVCGNTESMGGPTRENYLCIIYSIKIQMMKPKHESRPQNQISAGSKNTKYRANPCTTASGEKGPNHMTLLNISCPASSFLMRSFKKVLWRSVD